MVSKYAGPGRSFRSLQPVRTAARATTKAPTTAPAPARAGQPRPTAAGRGGRRTPDGGRTTTRSRPPGTSLSPTAGGPTPRWCPHRHPTTTTRSRPPKPNSPPPPGHSSATRRPACRKPSTDSSTGTPRHWPPATPRSSPPARQPPTSPTATACPTPPKANTYELPSPPTSTPGTALSKTTPQQRDHTTIHHPARDESTSHQATAADGPSGGVVRRPLKAGRARHSRRRTGKGTAGSASGRGLGVGRLAPQQAGPQCRAAAQADALGGEQAAGRPARWAASRAQSATSRRWRSARRACWRAVSWSGS